MTPANRPPSPASDRRKNTAGLPPEGTVVDRRLGIDRRKTQSDGDPVTGLERRRGRGRRLGTSRKAAEEGEMTPEQFLFLMAIDAFKKSNGSMYPTWSDVLEVVRLLGYRKTMASEINLLNAEDWREPADAPSNVRPDGWERRFTEKERAQIMREADLPELEDLEDIEDAA